MFATTLYSLRILRVSKRISMLANVLNLAKKDLSMFSVSFWIFYFAFAAMFYIIYAADEYSYRSYLISWLTNFQVLLHRFCYANYLRSHALILGPVLFCTYSMFMSYIVLTVFVVILNHWTYYVRYQIWTQVFELFDLFILNYLFLKDHFLTHMF